MIRISSQRKETIATYANASVFLYGIITLDDFVDVFNHYETAKTTTEEAELALVRYAKTHNHEYSLFQGLLSHPEIQPDFDDYLEVVTYIRTNQKNKPRYLPNQQEFLRYSDGFYIEPLEPYHDLKKYILQHEFADKKFTEQEIDDHTILVHEMVQRNESLKEILNVFNRFNYIFQEDNIKGFIDCLVHITNNMRIFENNGYTPSELALQSKNDFQANESEFVDLKPARNKPCPCGSNKKFKNCHGKHHK